MGIHSSAAGVLTISRHEQAAFRKDHRMQTLYVGMAFSMMVILPLLVAKWSKTPREDFEMSFDRDR